MKKVIYWILLLAWLCFAIGLSRQTGEETSRLSLVITGYVGAILRSVGILVGEDWLHLLIRKIAHIVIYSVLGFLMCGSLGLTFRGKWKYLLAIGLCLGIAFFDEWQKGAIPGRHCQWDEAALNAVCSIIGILLAQRITLKVEEKQ